MLIRILTLAGVLCAAPLSAQGYSTKQCSSCAEWNRPHAPVKLFANSYYVGTDGLSAILITSPTGHVLIDGGLPESAPVILKSIVALGFRVQDVKLILNSHDHYDHAGGIAELARATGAVVAASAASAETMRAGISGPGDPQFAIVLPFPKVSRVREIADGDTLRVGELAVVAHFTPGHTAGGTTWSWRSCEAARCLDMVYADSQSAISDNTFRYSGDPRYPAAAADFAHGQAVLERLHCDVLITPHPGGSALWERLAATGTAPGLVDAEACKRYAATARAALEKRLATERGTRY
ncbi:subclass B3 metallo-beta-lactamase [Gemmatimonas sp.]|uniref:subclass B3 metallo-beta-lactamase n=1 Tax=Gemmatimonas sp. TaxID=1962908 RepID=UPI003983C58C